MSTPRKPYRSDVSDDEWAYLGPFLTLVREDAKQRERPLRELLNAARYVVKTGWSSGGSRGWRGSAAWPGTTSAR